MIEIVVFCGVILMGGVGVVTFWTSNPFTREVQQNPKGEGRRDEAEAPPAESDGLEEIPEGFRVICDHNGWTCEKDDKQEIEIIRIRPRIDRIASGFTEIAASLDSIALDVDLDLSQLPAEAYSLADVWKIKRLSSLKIEENSGLITRENVRGLQSLRVLVLIRLY
ncbi:MAG: hypothetical protein R3C17_02805 [Planctomycetaceae bacterium]